MSSKGIRKLRALAQPERPAAEAPAVEPVTLEQLQEANKSIEVQIGALGAQLVDYNNVLRNIAVEAVIGMLIENGIIDRHAFELRKEAMVNVKLSEALEQVKLDRLQQHRAELRKQADLEVAKGPGLIVPRRLHG